MCYSIRSVGGGFVCAVLVFKWMHVRSAFYMPYNYSYITQKKKKQKNDTITHLRNIRTAAAAASETHKAAAAACVHQQMSERKVLCV